MSDYVEPELDGIEKSATGHGNTTMQDDRRMRLALMAALEHGNLSVGDEVICAQGALSGVIVEHQGGWAGVSWATR